MFLGDQRRPSLKGTARPLIFNSKRTTIYPSVYDAHQFTILNCFTVLNYLWTSLFPDTNVCNSFQCAFFIKGLQVINRKTHWKCKCELQLHVFRVRHKLKTSSPVCVYAYVYVHVHVCVCVCVFAPEWEVTLSNNFWRFSVFIMYSNKWKLHSYLMNYLKAFFSREIKIFSHSI